MSLGHDLTGTRGSGLGTGGGGLGGGDGPHPWKIYLKNFGTADEPDWTFYVYRGSRLLKSLKNSDTQAVGGLPDDYEPEDDDPGWHSITGTGIRVWVEIELPTDDTWPAPVSAAIKWDGDGDSDWAGGELEWVDVSGGGDTPVPQQIYARRLLGIIYDQAGDGNLVVDQWVDEHLFLMLSASDKVYDSGGANPKATPICYPFDC